MTKRFTLGEVRALLDQAWRQPLQKQREWLKQNCDDSGLRDEVLALLLADQQADTFLAGDAGPQAAVLLGASAPVERRQIGAYRLVEPIGRGGMGEVYRAERADGAFEQQVAIKLLQRHLGQQRQRFFEEQKILARLEHANIARLIDGGIWEGDALAERGRPYLVMEYVEGAPVSLHCDQHDLGLEARLDLFRLICEAVHYAHRNLIVHRDLKPSNILVTADGQPKLLDFGIATILADRHGTAQTRTPLMTPEYAAPEQIRGEAITTSTDVYALGLLLYELVTGRQPFAIRDRSPSEVEELICNTQPAAPSEAVAHGRCPWGAKLRGDLDTILLKALHKEPERRYASARALAGDLQNFLRGRPVEARPDSWQYRSAKFIQRHQWETIAAVCMVGLLITASVVASVSAVRTNRALERSRIEIAKSEQISEFLRGLFASADLRQTDGEIRTIADLLQDGEQRLAELGAQPSVQALLARELARMQTTLGDYSGAERLFTMAVNGFGDDATQSAELATTLHQWSIAEDERGNYPLAEQHAREALQIRRTSLPPGDAAIGESLDRLGAVIGVRGDYVAARSLIREAVAILSASAGELDDRTQTALHNLAWLYGRLRNYPAAERTYRRVVAASEQVNGPNDPAHLDTLDSLAVALRRQNKLDEAELISRDVLERRRLILGPQHQAVGRSAHNLARLLSEQGELEESRALFESAITNWRVSLGPDHQNLGVGLSNLARVYERLNDSDQAIVTYQAAVSILKQYRPGQDVRLGDATIRLGRLLTKTGELSEGEKMLRLAESIRAAEPERDIPLLEARMELAYNQGLAGKASDWQLTELIDSILGAEAPDSELRERVAQVRKLTHSSRGGDN